MEERPESEQLADAPRPAGRGELVRMLLIGLLASVLGVALGLYIDWWPEQGSEQASQIDDLYDLLIIVSVPIFVLVEVVVLYSVWRFRQRPGEELKDGPPIHGNTRLEIIWTTIPAVILVALCSYAYVVLRDVEEAQAGAMKVRVLGEQFTWTFEYPAAGGGEKVVSNQLYLPQNKPVLFEVNSKDVIHDFWVPAFRLKTDAIPGVTTRLRSTPTRLGRYPVVCAELCGLGHSAMRQTAHVVTQARFDAWLAKERGGAAGGAGGQSAAVDGKDVFTASENACGACHVLGDAATDGAVGPSLDEVLPGQDAAAIRKSIVEPNAELSEGFGADIMPPSFGDSLSKAELDALVAYLGRVSGK